MDYVWKDDEDDLTSEELSTTKRLGATIGASKESSTEANSSKLLSDITLGELVEDTFKEHFAAHGKDTIALLAKVDPATYIKQITSLVPKQSVVKAQVDNSHSHSLGKIPTEIINFIDTLTGRINQPKIEKQVFEVKHESSIDDDSWL